MLDRKKIIYEGKVNGKRRESGWIDFACPFCKDRRRVFGINLSVDRYKCFKCGVSGKLSEIEEDANNSIDGRIDIREIRNTIKLDMIDAILDTGNKDRPNAVTPDRFLEVTLSLFSCDSISDMKLRRYVLDRGIKSEELTSTILTSTDPDFVPDHVIFPIYYRNRLLSYQTRSRHKNAKPKTLNPSISDGWKSGSGVVYSPVKIDKYAFIVEGIFSCLSLLQMNIPAVGILKSEIDTKQVYRIRNMTDRVVLALDPDVDKRKIATCVSHLMSCFEPNRIHIYDWRTLLQDHSLPMQTDFNDLLLHPKRIKLTEYIKTVKWLYRSL